MDSTCTDYILSLMSQRSRLGVVFGLFFAAAASAVAAGSPVVEPLPCVPIEANAAVKASLPEPPAGAHIRLYFRRLNRRGAFYFTRMRPAAAGAYWSVLPRPEHREQTRLDDEWWEVLRQRDWMRSPERDRVWLEQWLEERQQEAAEYYVAVHAPSGELIERSDVQLVDVRPAEECPTRLDAHEAGWAANLTVGETTDLQAGRQLFHWLCEGIVTRISAAGILRADDYCRPCMVGSNRTRNSHVTTPAP